MPLDKAIEILSLNLSENVLKMPPDCRDALALSIQALKRCKNLRYLAYPRFMKPLPGETEE